MKSIIDVRLKKQSTSSQSSLHIPPPGWKMSDTADRVLVISACGDFIYSNSRFGSSPALMCRFDFAPQAMCFSLSTSAAWWDLESVFSVGWIYCTHHTNAPRLVTCFPRNSWVLKQHDLSSWENNLESRSVKVIRATGLCALKLQLHMCSFFGFLGSWIRIYEVLLPACVCAGVCLSVLPWSNCFWMLSWSVLFPLTRYRPSVVRPANTNNLQFSNSSDRLHSCGI